MKSGRIMKSSLVISLAALCLWGGPAHAKVKKVEADMTYEIQVLEVLPSGRVIGRISLQGISKKGIPLQALGTIHCDAEVDPLSGHWVADLAMPILLTLDVRAGNSKTFTPAYASVTKAEIIILDTDGDDNGSTITIQFNPTTYTIEK